MIIYAFLGRKESGKNTAEDFVSLRHKLNGVTITELSFAGPIKDALVELLNVDKKHFHDQALKKIPLINDMTPTTLDAMVW